ncbi:cell death-inducing p53-target protein 1-like [Betta splendens]|uniref:Cell death-inducing p53-target protein 1-like n=1 Tax=Betta splendens TaxID=158456 RepID=A0A6P7N7R4_BETSP|nr:cell death-inducing p53-target protein 1-like [Betta splendens]
MTSPDGNPETASMEFKQLSLRRQQLLERKKILCIFQELRNRTESGQTVEAKNNQIEIAHIDDKLKELSEMKAELQNSVLAKNTDSTRQAGVSSSLASTGVKVLFVDPPPNIPAPTVILDLENLPPHPCRTKCPECQQFIMTETVSTVSSVTWLVCFMTAMMGCVAGCCLIPFCLRRFKSITHRCPKCRSAIVTIKKL